MAQDNTHPRVATPGSSICVWIGLLLLTAATVTIASLQLEKFSIWGCIVIASIKAGLVMCFFMDLIREERVVKIMLFVAILTLTVIIGLTFFDVGYR